MTDADAGVGPYYLTTHLFPAAARLDTAQIITDPRRMCELLELPYSGSGSDVEQDVRWLPMEAWRARTALHAEKDLWKRLPELCRGRRVYAGLDLSSTRDITSLMYYLPEGLPEWGSCPVAFGRHCSLLHRHHHCHHRRRPPRGW